MIQIVILRVINIICKYAIQPLLAAYVFLL